MPIRLVVADDHPLVLDGVENLFRLEEDFQLLARCTDGTVKVHLHNICEKLNLKGRSTLLHYAQEKGLI